MDAVVAFMLLLGVSLGAAVVLFRLALGVPLASVDTEELEVVAGGMTPLSAVLDVIAVWFPVEKTLAPPLEVTSKLGVGA